MHKWIQGERLRLRPITLKDTDKIIFWRNQSFVRENFIFQKSFTVEIHHQWFHTMIETGKAIQYIITRKDNGEEIGSVYFRDIDDIHRKAEFGIFVGDRKSLHQGFGTEACWLACRHGFEAYGWHKIFLRVFATNIFAIRSYQRAGFLIEAFLKDDVCIHGKFRDIVLMGIINTQNSCA